ncbi:NUDIX hydrolase [Acinetobacter guillouiae]|uniref:NUDIX hydrolase n=1 Tax=Acinetobacter guillouiae TaxID=106649 RepID=UPI0004EF5DCA|nr:NUDIX domain-containing protein [Acinetobacter guillouiae]MBP2546815.1 8-oxo-dGTP pyrophosphatase MutT (NUDIX family) [Acinetobacter guillouiae]BAP38622.1 putative hydrolase [Acinetobacter guillouiae]
MGFHDFYRLSSHAVIFNENRQVLLLKATYADCAWGLPGGGLDQGETVHDALIRECQEELGCDVSIEYLSGVYYHSAVNSHAFMFRCTLQSDQPINLSDEHSEYRWFDFEQLSPVQKIRIEDCFHFDGQVKSRAF